ncbi:MULTISPECIES: hypothetical protein [Enterobacter]|jgi:hypothetical protein|uniref:hypothetical protein n=1 Tax=Enterobacter TaxID=547 RepID=UPI0011C3860F|nr:MULTISPECIES: hypothetical protein [Enterobacter]WNI51498.1 hypothetical protein RIK63_09305 [Enterobacter asburiae]
MKISVVSDGKILVESGVFNSIVAANNESQIRFNYDGLYIKFLINTYIDPPANIPPYPLPNFQGMVENGEVVLRQPVRCNDSSGVTNGYAGMLVPLEVGVKHDGKKIYMSWSINIIRAIGGALVATTHYSFYEDV